MLKFKELRERVLIVDVLANRGIKLRYKLGTDYASGPCPLKSHPQTDRGNSFAVHLPSNRFQCKNSTCQKGNGVGDKWGDCINLLSGIEGIGLKDAANKLNDSFPQNKNPAHQIDERGKGDPRASSVASPPANTSEHSSGSDNGKGYIKALDGWFDEVFRIGPELRDDPFWKKCRNAVKAKCIESYNNGKTAKT